MAETVFYALSAEDNDAPGVSVQATANASVRSRSLGRGARAQGGGSNADPGQRITLAAVQNDNAAVVTALCEGRGASNPSDSRNPPGNALARAKAVLDALESLCARDLGAVPRDLLGRESLLAIQLTSLRAAEKLGESYGMDVEVIKSQATTPSSILGREIYLWTFLRRICSKLNLPHRAELDNVSMAAVRANAFQRNFEAMADTDELFQLANTNEYRSLKASIKEAEVVLVAPPENDDRPQSSRRPAPAADESVASTADGKKHYARPTYGPIVREGAGRNVSAETVFALAYEVLIEERTEAGARFAPVRVQDPDSDDGGAVHTVRYGTEKRVRISIATDKYEHDPVAALGVFVSRGSNVNEKKMIALTLSDVDPSPDGGMVLITGWDADIDRKYFRRAAKERGTVTISFVADIGLRGIDEVVRLQMPYTFVVKSRDAHFRGGDLTRPDRPRSLMDDILGTVPAYIHRTVDCYADYDRGRRDHGTMVAFAERQGGATATS